MSRTIFVTVGTTLFDKLVSAATAPQALEWMSTNGYGRLVIQYGKGKEPTIPTNVPLEVETYRFRPTLSVHMQEADLILSHAGAGTVMEATKMNKRLVVVINTLLMDNHQTELANAMGGLNHLYVVDTPEQMDDLSTWDVFEKFVPVLYEGGDDTSFPRVLDAFMGFNHTKQS